MTAKEVLLTDKHDTERKAVGRLDGGPFEKERQACLEQVCHLVPNIREVH